MKHRLCVRGRRALYQYLSERNVGHRRFGKLVVATREAEEQQIATIYQRALANGVEGISLLTGAEARALEPNLHCVSALLSAETGIIDAHGYMLALQGEIEAAGGAVVLNAPALRGRVLKGGGFEIEIGGESPTLVRCRVLVNAAALAAQNVASSIEGAPKPPPLMLAKGSYFSCAGKPAFTHLIYPAPVDGGLGVHLTLDLGGRMRFGPDVEWLDHADPARVDYAVDAKRGDSFYAAIRRYWPGLPDGALTPDYSGCRPKLSGPGQPAADFRIDGPPSHQIEGLVLLFGIESPGLTSSPAIALEVAELLR
jgi:L-2-hydroxyglutarate oxidase LhgO